MKNYKYFLFSLFLLTLFSNANFVFASTEIYGGIITSDTVWTKESSPYIIYSPIDGGDDFTVGSDATLTIEAGTIIKLDYGESIKVLGKLVANGNSEEKIYFTSINDPIGEIAEPCEDADLCGYIVEPYNYDWSGIEVKAGGNIDLKHSVISYANDALYSELSIGFLDNIVVKNCENFIFASSSVFDITNSNVSNISGDAFFLISSSSVSFISSNINNVGGELTSLMFDSGLNIENSNIENISSDFSFVYSSSSLNIKNSQIKNTVGLFEAFNNSKVTFYDSDVKKVTGGYLAEIFNDSSIDIKNSNIENFISNESAAFSVFNDSLIKVASSSFSDISANTIFQVFNNSSFDLSDSSIKNISGIAVEVFQSDDGFSTTTLNILNSTISGGNDIGLEIFGKQVNVNISKTKIQNFAGDGIQTFSYPNIFITDSEISGNNNGIVSWGTNLEIKNSSIIDNKNYGISNVSPDDGYLSIKAINNWWGDKNGPYYRPDPYEETATSTSNMISWNVEYNPWLLDLPGTKPKCCSNVMFLPGLEASRLYIDEDEEEKIWEPPLINSDNSLLYLDDDGNSIKSGVYTKDVIDSAYVWKKGNIYSSFISSMNEIKNEGIIKDWATVPYDWRMSVEKLLENGTKSSDGKIYYYDNQSTFTEPYIISELKRLAESSDTGKVTIIAHSNGGLVTKELINKLGDEASKFIDDIIFVAVPQVGTPQAIGSLLHGFDEGLPVKFMPFVFSPTEARNLGVNMESAYGLIPSDQYFNYVSDPVITFDDSDLLKNFSEKYGAVINSGTGLYNFLSDQNREDLETKSELASLPNLNEKLYDSSVELHNNKLDNWQIPDGVKLTEIAGWGEKTLSGIDYYQGIKTECVSSNDISGCTKYNKIPILEYKPKMTIDGDGTVVVPSALWMASSSNVDKYWLNLKDYDTFLTLERKHADILEIPELNDFIKNIIVQSTSSLPKYISVSAPINNDLEESLSFTLHSPLTLDLYDVEGNHTGISTTTNEIEENIPGSRYLEFGEVKYISVPASSTVYLSMLGYSSGSFTLNIDELEGNNIIASTTFAGIPSASSTIVTTTILNGDLASTTPLLVDINGDGESEISLPLRINEIVEPDLSKKQNNHRRRIYEELSNTNEIIEDNFKEDIGSKDEEFLDNQIVMEDFIISDYKNNIVPANETISTTSISLNNKVKEKIDKQVLTIIKKENKSLDIVKNTNNNQNLVASVGNISENGLINKIVSFIKKTITKIFSW